MKINLNSEETQVTGIKILKWESNKLKAKDKRGKT